MPTLFEAADPNAAFQAVQRTKVSVNGVSVPTHDIAREVQHHEALTPIDAWQQAVRSLALRELLLQEARRTGLRPRRVTDDDGRRETDEDALIRQLIERDVATPTADEAACRRYYENNRDRFRSPDIFEASHILIAAGTSSDDPLADARALAHSLIAALRKEPGRFAEYARLHSACPSGRNGGNLGQLTQGDTTPAFDIALNTLLPGQMTTEPVVTPYGVHIIRLDRKIEGHRVPFEAVQTRIAEYLTERSTRRAIAQYLARLAAGAELVGVTMPTPQDVGVF